MLAVVKPGDVVVAAKMDRMFRSASNALQVIEDFKKRHILLWRLDLGDDCSGKRADRHHPGGCAQFERGLISERIKDAKRAARRDGLHLAGTRQFGRGRQAGAQRAREAGARPPRAQGSRMKIRTADEDFRRQFWQLYKERLYLIPQQLAHELNCTQVLINRLREETTLWRTEQEFVEGPRRRLEAFRKGEVQAALEAFAAILDKHDVKPADPYGFYMALADHFRSYIHRPTQETFEQLFRRAR